MKPESPIAASLVTLGLATAMHLDWHVARPAVHHLSLGWRWHWLLAVPVFAVLAWYVRRAWPDRPFGPSAVILIVAIFLDGNSIQPSAKMLRVRVGAAGSPG